MRRALRVAAAGFFIVRIRLRHKFRECGVHLHVVRKQTLRAGLDFCFQDRQRGRAQAIEKCVSVPKTDWIEFRLLRRTLNGAKNR